MWSVLATLKRAWTTANTTDTTMLLQLKLPNDAVALLLWGRRGTCS
jgi:hypothetical protein